MLPLSFLEMNEREKEEKKSRKRVYDHESRRRKRATQCLAPGASVSGGCPDSDGGGVHARTGDGGGGAGDSGTGGVCASVSRRVGEVGGSGPEAAGGGGHSRRTSGLGNPGGVGDGGGAARGLGEEPLLLLGRRTERETTLNALSVGKVADLWVLNLGTASKTVLLSTGADGDCSSADSAGNGLGC